MMDSIEEVIRRHAAANRQRYGRADVKAVFGQVLAASPEARKNTKEVLAEVEKIVSEINLLSEEELKSFAAEEKRSREERIPELTLKDVPKPLVMRFAPNPNGPATLGSARGMIVNSVLARKYGGKYILRFDDTDPRTKRPMPEAYNYYLEDCRWLDASPDEVYVASERIEKYYEYAEKLIKLGGAYVCFCPQEDFKKLKDEGKACPHRDKSVEENLLHWREMLGGKYGEGEAVLRIKTDIKHRDPAMRDWVGFRIIDEDHPRIGKKYIVWPMLDFESAIEDHLLGVTLIIRGIDLMDSEGRQKFIYNYFGWSYPKTLHWGRVRMEEFGKFSTSMIKKAIAEGQYSGWDDPRLPTLMAMRRRGIQPETIRRIMVFLGLGENDVALSLETIFAENRKILDPKVNRYFFVCDPVKVSVKNAPNMEVKVPLHPSFRERGNRELKFTGELFISREDAVSLKVGEIVRFMNLFNAKITRVGDVFEAEYLEEKILDCRKISWVSDYIRCKVQMPEEIVDGYAEKSVLGVRVGEVVQFERFGFVRLDSKDEEGGLVFYFGHR